MPEEEPAVVPEKDPDAVPGGEPNDEPEEEADDEPEEGPDDEPEEEPDDEPEEDPLDAPPLTPFPGFAAVLAQAPSADKATRADPLPKRAMARSEMVVPHEPRSSESSYHRL